eukprot:TRINITY_DN2290_c0_g3_i1.p1 TRINITY_DN2290_c0_g3~~TRINITY_DN2290_c0_g3_i1.p1  ORF type:complete len:633 (-),score=172.21 TRINITY_DN2290_c0_g3_i1:207-2105(-)
MSYIEEEEEEEYSDSDDEFEIDDDLGPLEKLEKYVHSDIILHRLHLSKELCDLANVIGYEKTVEKLFPVAKILSNDVENVVRHSFADQIIGLCEYCLTNGKEDGKNQILNFFFPIISSLIIDNNIQIRANTASALVTLWSDVLDPELQEEHLYPILHTLGTDENDEEHRVESAQLLGITSEIIIPVLYPKILTLLEQLCTDVMFRVRKACSSTIAEFSKVVDKESVNSTLLNLFLKLSNDEIWGVRKACAESLVLFSSHCNQESRENVLCDIVIRLAQKDSSRWVRASAFQNLGPFIATYDQGSEISMVLLNLYKDMINGSKSPYGDSDTIMYCAFSFPGVLLTLGKNKWEELKDMYLSLCKDIQWKVRRTLSHSLHEVAKIVGTEIAEAELLEIFELFLKDLDQVKVGIVKNISQFLKVLTPEKRDQYVDVIKLIQQESVTWRFRKLISKQLSAIAELYSDDIINEYIIPISLQLIDDQVTTVRDTTAAEIGHLLTHLKERNDNIMIELINKLTLLSESQSCYTRQTFAFCCEHFSTQLDKETFCEYFYDRLINLSKDNVPNVRYIVSKTISQYLILDDNYTDKNEELNEIIEILKTDPDREVRYFCYYPLQDPSTFPRNPKNLENNNNND